MTLSEFLSARHAEATEDTIIADAAWEAVQMRIDPRQWDDWFREYGDSTAAQTTHLASAVRSVGWAILSVIWPAAARREAACFAHHPDYRQEWAI